MLPPCDPSGRRRARPDLRLVVPGPLPVEVERREVQDLLDGGEHLKVVLLVAPSGYGKTTVLAQWARRQGTLVVWLRLGEEDRDPRSLLGALAGAAAHAGVRLRGWNRARAQDLHRERLISALAADLNAHGAGLTLVLDGGEYLGQDSARALGALIGELGPGHRFLVAQRGASPFNAAPFLARGEGRLIPADRLAFTTGDTGTAARFLGAPPELAPVLQEQYRGWPAGVMLALHTHQDRAPVPGTALVRHLVGTLPAEMGRVLPQLAVLTTWSAEDAWNLDLPLPPGWLEDALRAGLPLTPLGSGRFAPHDVLREFLTDELRQDVDLWRALHLRVGERAEAGGEPYGAIRHYAQAGQEDRAMRLAENLLPRWHRAADWLLVRETLEGLPPARLTPPLRSVLALALLETGATEQGHELAQEQVRLCPTAMAHYTLNVHAYRTGNMPEVIRHLDAGLAVATDARDTTYLLRSKAVYFLSVGRLEEGLALADVALGHAVALGDSALQVSCLGVKGFAFERRAEKDRALREYERAYHTGRQLGLTHPLVPIVDRLATLYLAGGRADEAARLLEEYVAVYERTNPGGALLSRRCLAQVRHAQGRGEEAVQLARQTFEGFVRLNNLTAATISLQGFFYREVLTGRATDAVTSFRWLIGQIGEERPKMSVSMWIMSRRMRACIWYVQGQWEQALADLDQVNGEVLRVYQRGDTLADALRAEIMRRQGQLDRSHADALARALGELPEDESELRMTHPHFEPLLREFVRRDWHAPLFRAVLGRCLAAPDGDGPPLELRLTTLGRLGVTLGGREIRLGHSPAVEALIYRLLHPGARQDELADAVWGGRT